ncbi:MAG: phosphoglycerate dehydrogenase [Pseudomonadota bacterium]
MPKTRIQTLNSISSQGLERFPADDYEVGSHVDQPDAIVLRSFKLHDYPIAESVQAVARAGAGTNNIPLPEMSARGVPVFNAPGANANAVKELVLASLFLSARQLKPAMAYTDSLNAEANDIAQSVEAAKKRFAGFELPGKTLGVVGLGAIGVEVCNAALLLGMQVIGYDPHMTVQRAWQLSSGVTEAESLGQMLGEVDMLTLHVPLVAATEGLISGPQLAAMKSSAVLINLARGGIVDDTAAVKAVQNDELACYVTDFPNAVTLGHDRVINLPHLGASTAEAEQNCAVMVVETVRDYLEQGNIRHSVNFPIARMPRVHDTWRLTVANQNVPNMVGQISTILADAGLNIADLLNKSRGELAYTIVDLDAPIDAEVVARLQAVAGVLRVRVLGRQ